MSPTPEQRPRQLNAAAQNNNGETLQIRVVPYSPPRFSSDASATASVRAVSSAQHEPEARVGSPHPTLEPTQPTATAAFAGVAGSTDQDRPKSTVSGQLRRTPSSTLSVNHDSDNASISSRASSSAGTPSARRPKRVITLNPDKKTFSLAPLSGSTASRTDSSFVSHRMPSMTPSGSWGRPSSSVYILEDHESSPAPTDQGEQSFATSSPAPLNELSPAHNNRLSSSPWNWRAKSADTIRYKDDFANDNHDDDNVGNSSQLDQDLRQITLKTPEPSPKLPPMRAIFPDSETMSRRITNKDSFQSIASNSTLSERTNYKVYGQSSPAVGGSSLMYDDDLHADLESLAPSSRHSFSNYRILGESSDLESLSDQQRLPTGHSDRNFVVHRRSVSCSSLASIQTRLRQEYSQESLMVAPLRPARKRSFEHGGIIKSCSRESLRRASLSSIGTTLSQEGNRSLFVGAASVVHIQGGLRKHNPRLISSGPSSGSGSVNPLASHPHHWSAPLSTVMSESEGGDSLPPSRSLSPYSATDRRSSTNSRHILSMSSSFAGLDEHVAPVCHSRNGSLERPPVALHTRHSGRDLSGASPLIRDYDEHGDGLADLDVLHHRPSRTRLAGRSNSGSDHVLRPSASTRSLNPLSFPAWARLYYCSEERRFLIAQASTDSMRSLYNGPMYNDQPPPGRAFLGHTPSIERMRDSIRNSRIRNRNLEVSNVPEDQGREYEEIQHPVVETADPMPDVIEAPSRVTSVVRRVKKQTSSIWSPHLHFDRRASRYSIWEPPVTPWSEEIGFDWRRNLQTILFTVGFVLPFSWIIAAFLPLPPKPVLEMTQQTYHSTSHLGMENESSSHSLHAVDELIYNHARWWRNLNRVMAVVGILVIGAVIALIVVGVKQQWTK